MIFVALAILLPGFFYSWGKFKEFSDRRRVHSILHVQCKTEDAETMDFAITLFQDESAESKQIRIQEVFEVCEARRKFNNDRMQQFFKEQQDQMAALKKQA
jgi:neutral trehalase